MTSFGDGGDQRNANVVLSANVSPYAASVTQADQVTRGFIANVDKLSAKMANLNRTGQRKLTGFAKSDLITMTGMTAAAATFDHQLRTLAATSAVTGRNFGDVKKSVENTFTALPVARGDVVQLTEALSQLGIKGSRDLEQLDKTYLKLAAASGEWAIGLAQGLTQLNRMMVNAGPEQVAQYANTLLVLSKNAGVSEQSVLDFSNSIAPMSRVLGLTTQQTMGLSTAFVKSGSDGFVAANLFNSMADEIKQSTQTGSPALLKYANLVGMTAQQFKELPAASKITDIVNAISRGGSTAQQFAAEMGFGPRQMAAITALAQSGDLSGQLGLAGSTSGTDALTKGSKAAFNDLTDEMVNFRNEMTQIATSIGGTFLLPVTKAMGGVNALAGALRGAIAPFSGFVGVAMAAAAPLAGMAALGMHAAGIIGTLALGRFLLRSTGAASLGLGRSMAQGKSFEQMSGSQQRAMTAFQEGTMKPWQYAMVGRGQQLQRGADRVFGSGGGPSGFGEAMRMGLIAPGRAISYLYRDSTRFLDESMRNDFERRGLQWNSGGGARQVMANLRASAAQGWGQIPREYGSAFGAGMGYLGGIVRTGGQFATRAVGAVSDRLAGGIHPVEAAQRAMQAETYARMANEKSMTGFTASLARASAATTTFAVETAKAGAIASTRVIGTGIGAAAGGLATAGSMALRAAFSPAGMIAILGAGYFSQRSSDADTKRRQLTESANWMQPVKAYNDQLGIVTTNLSAFNNNLVDNSQITRQLGKVTEQTSMKVAGTLTNVDVINAAGAKVSDQNLKTLAAAGAKTSELVAYISSLGINDPRTLKLVGSQALSAGFSLNQVNQATAAVVSGKAANPAALGRMVGGLANKQGVGGGITDTINEVVPSIPVIATGLGILHHFGILKRHESTAAIGLRGPLEGMIQSNYDKAQQSYGDAFAAQRKFIDTTRAISAMVKTGGRGIDEAAKMAHEMFGGSTSDFKSKLSKAAGKGGGLQAVVDALGATTAGGLQVNALRGLGGSTQVPLWSQTLAKLKSGQTDAITAAWVKQGPMGQFLAQSPAFKAATAGPSSEHPDVIFSAVMGTTDKFVALGSQTSHANTGLGRLSDGLLAASAAVTKFKTGLSPDSRGYAVLSAVQSEIGRRLSIASAQSTPQRGLAIAASQLQAARVAVQRNPTDPAAGDNYQAAQTNYDQKEEDQRQYLISMIKMVKDYTLQRKRAEQDYITSTLIANRDFHLSMEHSERDFGTSQLRAKQDFALQLKRQAEDTAFSTYNPFQRVQPQFTTDASTASQNMTDIIRRLRVQRHQIGELLGLGVSQATIDALGLADPKNAQQTDNFYQTIKNSPTLIRRMNRQVGQEQTASTALTQSPYSRDFRRAVEDFSRSSGRAVHDFNVARGDALQAHRNQMNDMAVQFKHVIERSQQDMANSLIQYTGSYSKLMDVFDDELKKSGGVMGAAAGTLSSQLHAMNKTIDAEVKHALQAAAKIVDAVPTPGSGATPAVVGAFASQLSKSQYLIGSQEPWSQVKSDAAAMGITIDQLRVMFQQHPDLRRIVSGLPKGFAQGGIALSPQMRSFAEHNPEMAIPLDARGQNFMAGTYREVSRILIREMGVANHGVAATGSVSTHYDYSTDISGPITVVAQDPNQMLTALEAKKRLAALTRPRRSS